MSNTFFLVEVVAEVPAPRRFSYRVPASSIAVAIARAVRLLRKDLPRKRLTHVGVKAVIETAIALPQKDLQ